jgi:hypothetical protein
MNTAVIIAIENLVFGNILKPNVKAHREPGLMAIRWSRLLALIFIDF